MAKDPRKRQKQQQRHAARRKAKQQRLTRSKQTGLSERLKAAAHCPVLHCWVSGSLWEQGMGWVGLSREIPHGQVAYAVFLVDRYCLGVKDALSEISGRFTYEDQVLSKARSQGANLQMSPSAARKLVEGAVEYAHNIGFHPHADYARAQLLFGDIDASQCTEEFEFGQDGKPLFIAGPYDTPERCRRIVNTLTQTCGPDGFNTVIPILGGASMLSGDLPALPGHLLEDDFEDDFEEEP